MTQRSDSELLADLNRSWRIDGTDQHDPSTGRHLLQVARRLVARLLRPQETFNSTVVQYLNANHADRTEAEQRIREAQEELRTVVGVLHHSSRTLSRELERLGSSGDRRDSTAALPHAEPSAIGSELDVRHGHTYVGFEDHFRGDPDVIRRRQTDYVSLFDGASHVLDVGCGRGEFLELLREQGVSASGIDVNDAMVAYCRERGLEASVADALGFIGAQAEGSLGGLFAAQVIEHLQPRYLIRLLEATFDKLRPGAVIVLETINPTCWSAFFDSYIRDFTHVMPVHPDTLKYLVVAQGFEQVEIRFRSPYPPSDKLQRVAMDGDPGLPPTLEPWVSAFNTNVDRINNLLFTDLDYAVVARRP